MKHLQAGTDRQPQLQFAEIFHRNRHRRGVEHGRRSPLVFARLGIDLVRQRDVGNDALEPLAEHLLVHRIGIGMQQRDRDTLHAGPLQPGHQTLDLRVIQRLQHPALVIEALSKPEASFRRHQRQRFWRDVETIEIAAAIARDLQHVGKAFGRHQCHFRQPSFDDGVGHARGAVDEALDLALAQADRLDRLQHRLNRSLRSRRHLRDPCLRGGVSDRDDVGEGAADIGANFPVIFVSAHVWVSCGRHSNRTPGGSRPSRGSIANRERSSSSPVMPPLASVGQSDGLGIGPELSQCTGPARDRRGAARHILVQPCPHGEHVGVDRSTRHKCGAPRIFPDETPHPLQRNPRAPHALSNLQAIDRPYGPCDCL